MSGTENTPKRQTHAWLLSSPDPEKTRAAALEKAAAMLCTAPGKRPCGGCPHCRKLRSGIHPDVSFVLRGVDDKGRQRREIRVDQIRNIIADAAILPNEAAAKVYIIPEADTMNGAAQNALLKMLEEPPEWVRLILCARRAEALLPTVRSRCVEQFYPGAAPEETEFRAEAQEYLRLLALQDRPGLVALCRSLDDRDTASCGQFVRQLRHCAGELLCLRETVPGLDRRVLPRLLAELDLLESYLRVNVSAKHILGRLSLPLPEQDG